MASKPRDLERAAQDRRRRINQGYSKRHPERAREERQLRKRHAEATRDHGHRRNGTVETLQKASWTQQGSLARLFEAGHITIDQLAASQEIRIVHDRIGRDVSIGTVSLETRVDGGRSHDGGFFEKLGSVRAEVAYTRWRASLDRPAPVLAMIAEDIACRAAAKRWRMRDVTARKLLSDALDAWPDYFGEACDEIDEATLLAAQAAIL